MDWRNLEDVREVAPSVATIGFFDGVHRGHQFLIGKLVEEARRDCLQSMVITFNRHPREVVQPGWRPDLLTTLEEKRLLLSKTQADACCVLPFDLKMASLSARSFMKEILCDRLNVKKLCIGYDNRFGHNRSEGFDDYVRYGKEISLEVVRMEAFGEASSSFIRALVKEGSVERASHLLGYPYSLTGTVVSGYRQGRRMGFPTANIAVSCREKLIPAPGVYAVLVRIEGEVQMRRAMMNIGVRPTFDGHRLSMEAHIFQFDENLYGKSLQVSFLSRIRAERKFDSVEELVAQLLADQQQVENLFLQVEEKE